MKILFIGRTEWLYNSIVEINMLDKHEIIGIVTSSSQMNISQKKISHY